MTQIAEYRTLVQAKGYDGSSTTVLDPAINAARRRLAKDRRWTWLQDISTSLSTTASDPEVSLATVTDLLHVTAVRLLRGTEEIPLGFMPTQELRDEQAYWPQIGEPEAWTRRGGDLLFYPTPDQVYTVTLEYITTLADISGSDEDIIPEHLQDCVAWAAVADLAFRQRDWNAARFAETQYQQLRLTAAGQDALEQRQTSRQVRSGYWGTRDQR